MVGSVNPKIPPQDVGAEMALLGSLLISPATIERVADVIHPEDFYRTEHQAIFRVILELFEKNIPVDLPSVHGRLQETKEVERVGGMVYLVELTEVVATPSHAPHYADIVKKKKILRDLIEASHDINALGFDEGADVELSLDEAEKRIFAISQRSLRQKFVQVKDTLSEAWDRLERLHGPEHALRGVPTGFVDLDNVLSGLQPSDLVILAARPSLGKTTLALDIARNVAIRSKLPVGVFSLEMSTQQIVDRLIAAEADVDLWKLRTGRLREDSDDFARIRDAIDRLDDAPIFLDDASSNTILEMRTMARRLKAEHGLSLIIVDYLQLMESRQRTENRVQEVSQFSRSLKALAKELDVPVLALSQLSRLVEQRHPPIPRLSDLRESGSIEQDADVVMFIYRDDKGRSDATKTNIAEIMIEKHRNGPTGKVELFFNAEKVRFTDVAKHMGAYQDMVV